MDPIVIVLGILFLAAAIAAVVFYGNVSKEAEKTRRALDEKATLEDRVKSLSDEISSLKPRLEEMRSKAVDNRGERKDEQKQIKALKQEVKSLREKLQSKPNKIDATDPLQLRAELTEASNLAAEMQFRAEKAEASLAELQEKLDSGEPVEVAPVVTSAGVDEEEVKALKNAHQEELKETSSRLRGEIKDAKERSRAELRQAREQASSEVKELRGKLNKATREVDNQRRRAENTNKAYRILQLQLDAALEKLALLDPETRAPGGFYDPEVEARLKEKAAAERQQREAAQAKQREADQQEAAAEALAQAMGDADAAALPEVAIADADTDDDENTTNLPEFANVPQMPGTISLDLDTDLVDAGWSLDGDSSLELPAVPGEDGDEDKQDQPEA